MEIASVRHKHLLRFIEDDDARGLRRDLVNRIRNVLTALIVADNMDEFLHSAPRGWRVHRLAGNRLDQWSVSVSGDWRITFNEDGGRIRDLNLEDYH